MTLYAIRRNVNLLAIWLGLSVGNFLYQSFAGQHWSVAMERSFFEGSALFAVWSVVKFREERERKERGQ